MREGTASHTARSVAARRLDYARAPASYGDPSADEALSRDVADGLAPRRNRMHEYLRARTAFFDRVVTDAVERGITQVVVGGAGYDGRALRYGAPGTRWFEIDHPATQADKRERLTRLGLDAAHVSFIPADFTADLVPEPLRGAGFDCARPALFLFEGVAVYLELAVTERVLAGFRAVAADGSLLAVSVSVGEATSQTRAQFQQRVAALGEPARTVLTADAAGPLLAAAGWQLAEAGGRQRSAGLLLARPAAPGPPERARPAPVGSPAPTPAPAAPAPASSFPVTPAPATPAPASPFPAAPAPATPAPATPAAATPAAVTPAPATPAAATPAAATPAAVTPAPAESAPAAPAGSAPGTASAGRPAHPAVPALPVTVQEAARLPLSALLSQALTAFTIEADNEAEHRMPHRTTKHGKTGSWSDGAWLTSLLMWANCLRQLPDEGLMIAELRDRARTSTNLDGMRRWGYVTFSPDPGHGKRPRPDTVIRPTARGSLARETWREAVAEVEARWQGRLGAAASGRLRAALGAVAADLDPALPDCLPILGHGLFSRPDRAREPREAAPAPARPASAADGPAGPSAGDEPAGSLPLWALLSRPLLAFALQYERQPGPSLAVSADVLRVLTEPGVLVKDIPALGGVSKESVAMALGWLRASGLAEEGPDPAGSRYRFARLTRRGTAARDGYHARAGGIEADWRARFGDAAVTALRGSLEPLAAGDPPPLLAGLSPYPDNWRAAAKPVTVLPHYPMTLHRGGYPDGS
jgi:methyltransferase (TIGR00027 family)